MRYALREILLGSVLVAIFSSAVRGQTSTVVVSVADAGTGAPIENAQVRMPTLGRLARADWLGEARIVGVPHGSYTVEVRALGYAPSDITLPVAGDSIGAIFMLQHAARQLDTVRVMANSVPVRLEPFENRRRLGIGRFLTDSVLAKEGTRSLPAVLVSHLPGLRLVVDTPATRWTLAASGTSGSAWDFNSIATGGCKVDIYLDGFPLIDNLESIFAADLAGIELYDMASAPPQYRQSSPAGAGSFGKSTRFASCKVLLLWSKY